MQGLVTPNKVYQVAFISYRLLLAFHLLPLSSSFPAMSDEYLKQSAQLGNTDR